MVGLVGTSLLTIAAISLYFTYTDTETGIERLQRARIAGAGASLEQLTQDLRDQVEAIGARGASTDRSPSAWRARFDDVLARGSAFRELAFVDTSLRERVRVRADGAATEGTARDRSSDRALLTAALTGFSVGPVRAGPTEAASRSPGGGDGTTREFTMAVRLAPPFQEIIVAEVGVEAVRQRLELLRQSDPRYDYLVVDSGGSLVAGAGSEVAADGVNPATLPFVAQTLRASAAAVDRTSPVSSTNRAGDRVLVSAAQLADTKWWVFVEELRSEAYAPVGSAITRTGVLAAIFLGLAALAAAALARRMTRPIRALTEGAEQIGAGALDQTIRVRGGGGELETLADEFNRMSGRLRESYRTLETRVADRTRDLTATLAENSRLFAELEERTRQLEVANHHKSQFLAGMSHELRTPLNAIIGFSEVMRDGLAGEITPRQAEYLRDINDSGRHLLALINDILDLSKVEAGQMELELGPVHLEATVVQATAMLRERAVRGGVTLVNEVDADAAVIVADARKLRQVLLNLVDNALRFTPTGGTVKISVRRRSGWVEIAVSDTGAGIAREDHEIIFQEFRQIGGPARGEGTGLGLSLCRRIAELHGGSISLQSAPGEGSVFTVRLPARSVIPVGAA
jgi:signal transduction histidine kinase